MNANVCPVCGDNDLDGRSVEVDGCFATQEVSCLACEAEWTDTYKLVSQEVWGR